MSFRVLRGSIGSYINKTLCWLPIFFFLKRTKKPGFRKNICFCSTKILHARLRTKHIHHKRNLVKLTRKQLISITVYLVMLSPNCNSTGAPVAPATGEMMYNCRAKLRIYLLGPSNLVFCNIVVPVQTGVHSVITYVLLKGVFRP